MDIDSKTMARATLAINKAVRNFLFEPVRGINLIDIGFKEVGGREVDTAPAIRFHVNEKKDEIQLEDLTPLNHIQIDGFETDVLVGSYHPQQGWWRPRWSSGRRVDARRLDPLQGGCSISAETHYGAGTLGALVRDRDTGEPMILSNWHVLAHDWWAQPGQRIYQPGRLDGGRHADTVGRLVRDAMSKNLDAAVAEFTGSRQLINAQLEIGRVTGATGTSLGMLVTKYGRTTRRTEGRVTGMGGVARMPYGHVKCTIQNVITIKPRSGGEVSAGGDSGSVWMEQGSGRAVGLHFAGGDWPERALAMEMQPVLEALNVTIGT